ncbi:hypothetical protein GCM10008090_25660 [Arenicella chitinivorans]|uniref:LPXTG cell wall anchor domain-containing protein n=1 Tax=Arenicella chitinivorans TaxID=1329800 RepID=A0A918RX24_9GAMM|nr:LPXTG cell wall anchor domain-containing protein [Arenicella chitinivorans]GHA14723.1 hypothetical protein GCM10008090_25660 [Arenicella chitinivorans]
MKHITRLAISLLLVVLAGIAHAQQTTTSGVVVSTNDAYQTITVRDDATGQRNTYFVGNTTELKSNTGPIDFSDIRRGQVVDLVFDDTDQGRELGSFATDNTEATVEIIPIEFEDHYTISGEVVGTRPAKRTITIRPEGKKNRRTINVPAGVTISRNGKFVEIEDLLIGDTANFKYQETVQGFVLVQDGQATQETGADTREAMQQSSDPVALAPMVLPATASNQFAWLIAGLAALMLAGGLMTFRRIS